MEMTKQFHLFEGELKEATKVFFSVIVCWKKNLPMNQLGKQYKNHLLNISINQLILSFNFPSHAIFYTPWEIP